LLPFTPSVVLIVLVNLIVEKLNISPNVVALGSSKLLQIDSSFFPNKLFINNSVSGATIDDFITIYFMYKKKGLAPKKIILGLDASLLNKRAGNFQYASVPSEYLSMSDAYDLPVNFF